MKNMCNNFETKEYRSWWNMIGRCEYECSASYAMYGSEGVNVCKEWRDNFLNFYNDMGPAPTKYHSIDRVDNNKGYYKENCRWATQSQQCMNRRLHRSSKVKYKGVSYEPKKKLYRARITINGKTKSLGRRKAAIEAAKLYDIAAIELFGEYALTNKMLGLLE